MVGQIFILTTKLVIPTRTNAEIENQLLNVETKISKCSNIQAIVFILSKT